MRRLPTLAAALLVLAAAAWSGWHLAFTRDPFTGTAFGSWTDHLSHRGSARLFARHGYDVYRKSPRELLGPPLDSELKHLNSWPDGDGRRLYVNWIVLPRAYPPLAWLLFAPFALVEDLGVGTATTNLLTVVFLLLVALACAFTWVRALLADALRRGPVVLALAAALAALGTFFAAYWGANGFYDCAAILLIFLAISAWRRRDAASTIGLWALAFGLHARTLWTIPLPAAAAVALLAEQRWRSRRDLAWLGLAALVAIPSGVAIALASQHLGDFVNNSLLYGGLPKLAPVYALLCAALSALAFHLRRDDLWRGLVLLTPLAILSATPQSMPWHALSLMPLPLLVGEGESKRPFVAALVGVTLVGYLLVNP